MNELLDLTQTIALTDIGGFILRVKDHGTTVLEEDWFGPRKPVFPGLTAALRQWHQCADMDLDSWQARAFGGFRE